MRDFDSCAARAVAIEAELERRVREIARAFSAPMPERDLDAIAALIGGLEPHRAPLRQALRAFNRIAHQPRGADSRAQAKIRSYFKGVAFRLGHWDAIVSHLRGMLLPDPAPLRPPPGSESVAEAHIRAVVDVMYHTLHLQTNPNLQDPSAVDAGAFPDIPLKYWLFVDLVRAAYRVALAQRRPRQWRFLDVGCGGGTKVLAAAGFFDEAAGLEFDPGYAAAAGRMLALANLPNARVMEGDALAFEGFGGFDVIYFFRPLSNPRRLAELERRIADQVAPGTLLLAPYDGFLERYRDYGHAYLRRWLYLAHSDAEAASALKAEAELMGPDVRMPGTRPNRLLGFWAPAIDAGFAAGRGLIL